MWQELKRGSKRRNLLNMCEQVFDTANFTTVSISRSGLMSAGVLEKSEQRVFMPTPLVCHENVDMDLAIFRQE